MIGEFSNVKIQGMAAAVPSYIEDNLDYVNILGERRTKRQIKLTGVSERHVASLRQRTSDLCYAAAIPLLKKLNWNKKDVKVLVFVTQYPNYILPSTAMFIHKRLGLGKDCVAFDINLGCSSFNVGIHVVAALLQNCAVADKALLLIGDTAGQILNLDDEMNEDIIADRMLFGSAGAAIAMEKVEHSNLRFMTRTDGNGYDVIIRHFGHSSSMNGEAVFQFAINDVADDVLKFKDFFNLSDEDIDFYIFHQAQKLILDNIAAVCNIPEEKELRSLDKYGNTSGTSVPVSLCANIDKIKNKKNIKVLFCGFGVGLSWGSIYTEIATENILPIIESDDHYDDDKRPAEGLEDKCIMVFCDDSDIGKITAKYLNDKSAEIVIVGTNKHDLPAFCTDLGQKGHYLINNDKDFAAQNILSYCTENNLMLDGVVFFNSVEFVKEQLQNIKNIFNKKISIAIVQEEMVAEDNIIRQNMFEIQELLNDCQGRVNCVVYSNSKIDFQLPLGEGQEWIRTYIQKGCPAQMERQVHLGNTLKYLLGEDSKYISQAVIPIVL